MMVVCGGAELFTGNSLIIIPIIEKRGKVGPLLTNWGIVFLGNLVGSVAIALMAVYGHTLSLYNGELAKMVVATAVTKVHLSFLDAFIRGILCNFMVCLAVWISFGAGQDMAGKILGLALPVFLFVLCGFEHCVANMYFIPAGMFASLEYGIQAEGLNVLSFLYGNLLPVVLGNIIGGAVLVGLGYWYAYLKLEK
jgi:formate/nitrite transporter